MAMTGRERMLTGYAHHEPDIVPVSPDLSVMVPVRLSGYPFDAMFLDGKPHHGYASASVAQAYVDAVKYYGIDGWYIYGGLPQLVSEDRPRWVTQCEPTASGGQESLSAAHTRYGGLQMRVLYPPDEPPWETEKPIRNLRGDWPRLRALMGEHEKWQWETTFPDRSLIG